MLFVPSSLGDAVDRLSILHIKAEKLGQDDDHEATEHVAREIAGLSHALDAFLSNSTVLASYTNMKDVNAILWDVEDRLRVLEAAGDFGDEFVQQARLVYTTNDRRAALKRQLNLELNSDIVEVKKYAS
jgi:hypothetical protein